MSEKELALISVKETIMLKIITNNKKAKNQTL